MPRLWTQIAGSLGVLTLAVLVLNAGVFWIVLEQNTVRRQMDLAWAMGGAMQSQLGAAVRSGADDAGLVAAVEAVGQSQLDLEQLVLMDAQLAPMVVVAGEVPDRNDPGVRSALHAKTSHRTVVGGLFDDRAVSVTVPVVGTGKVRAVLQLRVPTQGPEIPGGALGFALMYAIASGGVIALFGWVRLRSSLVAPIERLREGTTRIAKGDLGHLLGDEETEEMQALVGALNTMSTGLRSAQDALIRSERLAGVGRMSAGLAHEIGNPLAAVMATVDLLQAGDGFSPEERLGMLSRARVELDRIDRIIQALLGYARTGDGQPSRQSIEAAVHDAVQTLQHQLSFAGISVEFDATEPPVYVWIEADKLRQVLVNILRNAADAPGVTVIQLGLSVVEGGQVEIRCADDGQGFSAVALERAPEPFFTTKDVGEGTGLGLSTATAVIGQAGGTIELSNTPESGACVRIRLPLSQS
jgi:two-component system, NtrC family, sensor kinase